MGPQVIAGWVPLVNIFPAGTLRYIDVVFMLRGYVKITFEFMLECLVLLTPPVHFAHKNFYIKKTRHSNIKSITLF